MLRFTRRSPIAAGEDLSIVEKAVGKANRRGFNPVTQPEQRFLNRFLVGGKLLKDTGLLIHGGRMAKRLAKKVSRESSIRSIRRGVFRTTAYPFAAGEIPLDLMSRVDVEPTGLTLQMPIRIDPLGLKF